MSAGGFKTSVYKSDLGLTFWIKIQPETEEFKLKLNDGREIINTAGTSPDKAKLKMYIHARGSARSIFPTARQITFHWKNPQDVPATYKNISTLTIPCLNPDLFQNFASGMEGTYLGKTIITAGKRPEKNFPMGKIYTNPVDALKDLPRDVLTNIPDALDVIQRVIDALEALEG